ncbi:hypothetical protein SNEBB_003378 [Seison nebaliae]|nr:hypothetical protein SNEBB_003378 [Seison nebaliae]
MESFESVSFSQFIVAFYNQSMIRDPLFNMTNKDRDDLIRESSSNIQFYAKMFTLPAGVISIFFLLNIPLIHEFVSEQKIRIYKEMECNYTTALSKWLLLPIIIPIIGVISQTIFQFSAILNTGQLHSNYEEIPKSMHLFYWSNLFDGFGGNFVSIFNGVIFITVLQINYRLSIGSEEERLKPKLRNSVLAQIMLLELIGGLANASGNYLSGVWNEKMPAICISANCTAIFIHNTNITFYHESDDLMYLTSYASGYLLMLTLSSLMIIVCVIYMRSILKAEKHDYGVMDSYLLDKSGNVHLSPLGPLIDEDYVGPIRYSLINQFKLIFSSINVVRPMYPWKYLFPLAVSFFLMYIAFINPNFFLIFSLLTWPFSMSQSQYSIFIGTLMATQLICVILLFKFVLPYLIKLVVWLHEKKNDVNEDSMDPLLGTPKYVHEGVNKITGNFILCIIALFTLSFLNLWYFIMKTQTEVYLSILFGCISIAPIPLIRTISVQYVTLFCKASETEEHLYIEDDLNIQNPLESEPPKTIRNIVIEAVSRNKLFFMLTIQAMCIGVLQHISVCSSSFFMKLFSYLNKMDNKKSSSDDRLPSSRYIYLILSILAFISLFPITFSFFGIKKIRRKLD